MPVTLLSGRPSSSRQTLADHPESLGVAEICNATPHSPANSTGKLRDNFGATRNDNSRRGGGPQATELFLGIGNFADYHVLQHRLN
jgi:hypothetical protein